ncbi:hypothetical protein [Microcoleus sp.]|uniref:hypothetical protein n=1 Tax=Microcoleus sp. TaxID=44472 RepID=UPI00403ED505
MADKALLSGIVIYPVVGSRWVVGRLEIYPLVLQINGRATTHPTMGSTGRDIPTINADRFPVCHKLLRHLNCMLKNNQTLVGWASRPP